MPKEIHEAPSGPKPLGPYSVVTEAHGLVFISGMVAIDPASGESVRGGVAPQAEQVMRNIGAVLGDVGLATDDWNNSILVGHRRRRVGSQVVNPSRDLARARGAEALVPPRGGNDARPSARVVAASPGRQT